MHDVVGSLLADHLDLQRLVRLLQTQPVLLADPLAPNIGLLVDALFYLTHYPDLRHHALEDRIARRLLEKNALTPGQVAEIETQHSTLVKQGSELLRDLESAVRDEGMPRALLESNLRLYAQRLHENMVTEEATLFPAAVTALDADDFARIERSTADGDADPLFPSPVEKRFEQLHRAIAGEADCDCQADPIRPMR
ncbi:MAG TPA: hemerythrin domain-containing protein [Burkholderiaceae bacterium]|nr:hemerythrin domain-containing protein [Burkholderiaceae bacterium]